MLAGVNREVDLGLRAKPNAFQQAVFGKAGFRAAGSKSRFAHQDPAMPMNDPARLLLSVLSPLIPIIGS